jgi:hypothetical protein
MVPHLLCRVAIFCDLKLRAKFQPLLGEKNVAEKIQEAIRTEEYSEEAQNPKNSGYFVPLQ